MNIALRSLTAHAMPTALAIVVLGTACTSSSMPADSPDPSYEDTDEAPPRRTPAASQPYARVVSISPSSSAPEDRRAHIEFINPTRAPCTVSHYELMWERSSKGKSVDRFVVPAGESRQRYLLLHPIDGNLASLHAESAKVKLDVVCGPGQ